MKKSKKNSNRLNTEGIEDENKFIRCGAVYLPHSWGHA
jgi:hypothetical protein